MVIQVNSNTISDVIASYRNNKNLSTSKQEAVKPDLGDAGRLDDFTSETFEVFSVWHDTAAFYDVRDIAVGDISKMSKILYDGSAISLEEYSILSKFNPDGASENTRIDLVDSYGAKLADDFEKDSLIQIGSKRNVMEHLKKLDAAKTGAIDIVA